MQKFVIITGGSSGIGRHLVHAFAAAGYDVAFTHLGQMDAADEVVQDVAHHGVRVIGHDTDVADSAAVASFLDQAISWAGQAPDVLINNAGIQTWAPLLELSEERWDMVIRTNLKGTFLNTKLTAQRMIDAGKGGSIINLGSGCNKLAFPKLVDYTASKGGIEQFTKVSAVELGPLKRQGRKPKLRTTARLGVMSHRSDVSVRPRISQAPPCFWPAISRVSSPARRSGSTAACSARPSGPIVTSKTYWVLAATGTKTPSFHSTIR
jgi:NADP-dependent 3-hydroxy acid dehydrogenase YdfG